MRRFSSLIAFVIIASIILISQLLISVQARNDAVGVRYITDTNTNKKVALIGSANYEFENTTANISEDIIKKDDLPEQVEDINQKILDIYNKLFLVINEKNNQSLLKISVKQKNGKNKKHPGGSDGGPTVTSEGNSQDPQTEKRVVSIGAIGQVAGLF
jgi:hypothetical protein